MPVVLHEDAFYEYFVPYRHPEARHNVWGGHGLETFGEDIQLVRRLDPEYAWTVVDGESDQWITPGVRYVNRICYLVTKKAHNWLDVDFRVARNARSLTAIGLRRQIRKIESLMLALPTD
jgi:hypothetical protein